MRVRISRHRHKRTGNQHWELTFRARRDPELTLMARMSDDDASILDYYLLPASIGRRGYVRLAERNPPALDQYRADDLDAVCSVIVPTARQ